MLKPRSLIDLDFTPGRHALWAQATGRLVRGSAIVRDCGRVVAFDAATARVLWSVELTMYDRPDPYFDDPFTVFPQDAMWTDPQDHSIALWSANKGGVALTVLDASTGAKLSRRVFRPKPRATGAMNDALPTPAGAAWFLPGNTLRIVLTNDHLAEPPCDRAVWSEIAHVDPQSGNFRWRHRARGTAFPVTEREQTCYVSGNCVVQPNPATGIARTLLESEFPVEGLSESSQYALITLRVSANEVEAVVCDSASGTLVQRRRVPVTDKYPAMLRYSDGVYWLSYDGRRAEILDERLRPLWKTPPRMRVASILRASGDTLLLVGDGLAFVKRRGGGPLTRLDVKGFAWIPEHSANSDEELVAGVGDRSRGEKPVLVDRRGKRFHTVQNVPRGLLLDAAERVVLWMTNYRYFDQTPRLHVVRI